MVGDNLTLIGHECGFTDRTGFGPCDRHGAMPMARRTWGLTLLWGLQHE